MDRPPEPSNDRQRAIAEAFDIRMLADDKSYGQVVSEVLEAAPFCMSMADIQCLFDYAH